MPNGEAKLKTKRQAVTFQEHDVRRSGNQVLNALPQSCDFRLESEDNQRLANVCGQFDENLRQVEITCGVEINNRGNVFQIIGDPTSAQAAMEMLKGLYEETAKGPLTPANVQLLLQDRMARIRSRTDHAEPEQEAADNDVVLRTRRGLIKVRGERQREYVADIRKYVASFGVGPAGTGKTYLAVAGAVEALEQERVRRLILVRPAVEAGERLGFLPGDLVQKIDPYLRPLYDALYEMLGFERVAKLIERNVIEVAPLAYMRGRTLNDAFIILDEAQNTTIEQMKMFLTRIGFGSIAVITGDITQIDLPKGKQSGLRHALKVLAKTEGIGITFFKAEDVVRHPLVQKIVTAYEKYDDNETSAPPR